MMVCVRCRKRQDGVYGNNLEIQAMGEIFNRPIEIYSYEPDPNTGGFQLQTLNIIHQQYETENAPVRLSYHHGNHYNSVVDPNNPTYGVGLGLPGLQPGVCLSHTTQYTPLTAYTVYPWLCTTF